MMWKIRRSSLWRTASGSIRKWRHLKKRRLSWSARRYRLSCRRTAWRSTCPTRWTVINKDSDLNFLNTSNMIFRKETWKTSGGFFNHRIEDLEFSWRLLKKGYRLIYSPKGLVIHFDNRNPIQNIRKYLQYGKSYSRISFIYNMSFPFKTNRILSKSSILNLLQLISLPFLLVLASLILNYIILQLILNLTLNILTYFLCFYILLRQISRFDILFKMYKFSILFAIANYSLIYITKRKFRIAR